MRLRILKRSLHSRTHRRMHPRRAQAAKVVMLAAHIIAAEVPVPAKVAKAVVVAVRATAVEALFHTAVMAAISLN